VLDVMTLASQSRLRRTWPGVAGVIVHNRLEPAVGRRSR
jgi:hypothetical protein